MISSVAKVFRGERCPLRWSCRPKEGSCTVPMRVAAMSLTFSAVRMASAEASSQPISSAPEEIIPRGSNENSAQRRVVSGATNSASWSISIPTFEVVLMCVF